MVINRCLLVQQFKFSKIPGFSLHVFIKVYLFELLFIDVQVPSTIISLEPLFMLHILHLPHVYQVVYTALKDFLTERQHWIIRQIGVSPFDRTEYNVLLHIRIVLIEVDKTFGFV